MKIKNINTFNSSKCRYQIITITLIYCIRVCSKNFYFVFISFPFLYNIQQGHYANLTRDTLLIKQLNYRNKNLQIRKLKHNFFNVFVTKIFLYFKMKLTLLKVFCKNNDVEQCTKKCFVQSMAAMKGLVKVAPSKRFWSII